MNRRAAVLIALLACLLPASLAQARSDLASHARTDAVGRASQAQSQSLSQMLDHYRSAAQRDVSRLIARRGRVSLRVQRRVFRLAGRARKRIAATPVARPEETSGKGCAVAAFARIRSGARWGIRASKSHSSKRRHAMRRRATRLVREGRARLATCVIPPPPPTLEIRSFAPSEPANEVPANGVLPGATLSSCTLTDPLWATFRWRDFPVGTVLAVHWRGAETFDATTTLATASGVGSQGLVATGAQGQPVALNNGAYTLSFERDGQTVATATVTRSCT